MRRGVHYINLVINTKYMEKKCLRLLTSQEGLHFFGKRYGSWSIRRIESVIMVKKVSFSLTQTDSCKQQIKLLSLIQFLKSTLKLASIGKLSNFTYTVVNE